MLDYPPLQKFDWTCQWPGCLYSVTMYSKEGLEVMKSLHANKHERDAKKIKEEIQKAHSSLPRDYDKLELTGQDKAFLKTRGIKYDD